MNGVTAAAGVPVDKGAAEGLVYFAPTAALGLQRAQGVSTALYAANAALAVCGATSANIEAMTLRIKRGGETPGE